MAIAASVAADARPISCSPCAGSGQALYVGLAEDAFVVASEPYGVVEETDSLPAPRRRDPGRPGQPRASRGQIVVLDGAARRHRRRASSGWSYDGTELPGRRRRAGHGPRSPPATSTAATSRTSCSRRSPRRRASFRKTLRGKLVEARRRPRASSSATTTLPAGGARPAAPTGGIRRVLRHRPGHRRGRRPEPRRGARTDARRHATCVVEAAAGDRAVRASACATT